MTARREPAQSRAAGGVSCKVPVGAPQTVWASAWCFRTSNGCGISAEEVRKRAHRDRISQERRAYREHPEPHYLTYGPKTRREFLNLLHWNGGSRA